MLHCNEITDKFQQISANNNTSNVHIYTDLQSEGQHDVRLGQDVSLVSHVQEGVVEGGAFELLFEVGPSFGHRQTLQVRHEQVDRRTQLLHVERLHVSGDKLWAPSLLQDEHSDKHFL